MLSVHIVSKSIDIFELVGNVDLRATIFGQKKEIRFKNFRLDICKILSNKAPATFVGYLEKGIKKTFYNFPKKCPLKQVSLYMRSCISLILLSPAYRTRHTGCSTCASTPTTFLPIYPNITSLSWPTSRRIMSIASIYV